MSSCCGPYSNPGVTGATTGPYAGSAATPAAQPDADMPEAWWSPTLREIVYRSGLDQYMYYTWDDDYWVRIAELPADAVRVVPAAAAPAPPVDVVERLRAVVKILDVSEPYVGRGREIRALSRMADYIEADPDDPESQAIARALTGEATS